MLDKLTMHLQTTLIGLSGLLSSCGIFSIDPQEEWINVDYKNDLNSTIEIRFEPDSLILSENILIGSEVLEPLSSWTQTDFVNNGDDKKNIETIVDEYLNFTIQLYQSDSLVKVWEDPPGYYGDSIHSPFNYDSWEIRPVESNPENVVGAVTFIITEEDLK